MEQRELRKFAGRLAERLKRAGFDWRSLGSVQMGSEGYYWQRPSVHVPSGLLDEPECLYSGIKFPSAIEEWTDVYARYVANLGAGVDKLSPAVRLATDLGLSYAAELRMIPRDDLRPRGAWYIPLVGYAMLLKGAYREGVEVTESPTSYVATHEDGQRFGVSGGWPVGALCKTPPSYRLRHPLGLSRLLAPYGRQQETPGVFDRLRSWVTTNADQFPADFDDVQRTISLLYWSYRSALPVEIQEMLYISGDFALQHTVNYARDFRNFRNPRQLLRELFVPEHLSAGRFERLFGYSGGESLPVLNRLAAKWDAALDSLYRPQQQQQ